MATAVATRTAREYLRLSKGKGRSARSIDDQHADNVTAEAEFGPWTWGEPYADTGSASRFARKARGDFERLTADLSSGDFGTPGTVLVLWEISRLARETGKGVALIDACEAGDVLIHVTSYERTYNPANYNDRHDLIAALADAEREALRLSKRTLRGVNSQLAKGAAHGKLPFGYARDYELIDGRPRPIRQYADPAEAPLIVELFERVAGWNGRKRESINAVAKDWLARGIVSRQTKVPFKRETLRPMLRRKAYVGVRVHKGSERPAEWPALIERDLFDAVQRIMADPTRRTTTSTAVRHALTMTVRCDVCGGPMTSRTKGDRLVYMCFERSCTRIGKTDVDAYLIGDAKHPGVILSYLSRPDVAEGLASSGDDTELSAVRIELANKRANLKEFEEAEPARTLAESRERARSIEVLETEVRELEEREHSLTAPDPLSAIFETGPGAAERWSRTDVTAQRAIAALLLAPEVIGQVRVRRVADSASEAVQDRLRWQKA